MNLIFYEPVAFIKKETNHFDNLYVIERTEPTMGLAG